MSWPDEAVVILGDHFGPSAGGHGVVVEWILRTDQSLHVVCLIAEAMGATVIRALPGAG